MTIGCSGTSKEGGTQAGRSRALISPSNLSIGGAQQCEPTTRLAHLRCTQSPAPTWCFLASTWTKPPAQACSGLGSSGSSTGTATNAHGSKLSRFSPTYPYKRGRPRPKSTQSRDSFGAISPYVTVTLIPTESLQCAANQAL